MEEQLVKLRNEIAENKRKIKELENQAKLPKVSKRDVERFKKFYKDTKQNNLYTYLRFIIDVERFGFGQAPEEEIDFHFGGKKKDIKNVEEARQYITSVKPDWNEYFLKCIDDLNNAVEDEDEDD